MARRGLIDGREIADSIEAGLKDLDIEPQLQIILVGDDEASETFVSEKLKASERVGFNAELTHLPEDTTEEELLEHIQNLNEDDSVHGILVQLPLPKHIDENTVFEQLKAEKDVDGLNPENLGALLRGCEAIKPAAVKAVETVLEHEDIPLEGADVCIVNNSALIGKPLSMALTDAGATVSVCHELTGSIKEYTSKADIIVTAAGEPGLITPEMVEEGCVVIDAGYENGKGDVKDIEVVSEKALLSPVPNGLGPVTVAITLDNLAECYRLQ